MSLNYGNQGGKVYKLLDLHNEMNSYMEGT